MSDELPTEERMRRIERGVQRRIDAHRASAQRVRQGVTGGLVVVLLLGGGFALLRSSAPASAAVPVLCHDGAATTTARADRSTLPASALRACASAAYGTEAAPNSAGGRSASPTVAPRVLCRAEDGALHVYPGAPVACSAHRMTAYRG
jgi:hypothetical protein